MYSRPSGSFPPHQIPSIQEGWLKTEVVKSTQGDYVLKLGHKSLSLPLIHPQLLEGPIQAKLMGSVLWLKVAGELLLLELPNESEIAATPKESLEPNTSLPKSKGGSEQVQFLGLSRLGQGYTSLEWREPQYGILTQVKEMGTQGYLVELETLEGKVEGWTKSAPEPGQGLRFVMIGQSEIHFLPSEKSVSPAENLKGKKEVYQKFVEEFLKILPESAEKQSIYRQLVSFLEGIEASARVNSKEEKSSILPQALQQIRQAESSQHLPLGAVLDKVLGYIQAFLPTGTLPTPEQAQLWLESLTQPEKLLTLLQNLVPQGEEKLEPPLWLLTSQLSIRPAEVKSSHPEFHAWLTKLHSTGENFRLDSEFFRNFTQWNQFELPDKVVQYLLESLAQEWSLDSQESEGRSAVYYEGKWHGVRWKWDEDPTQSGKGQNSKEKNLNLRLFLQLSELGHVQVDLQLKPEGLHLVLQNQGPEVGKEFFQEVPFLKERLEKLGIPLLTWLYKKILVKELLNQENRWSGLDPAQQIDLRI